MSHVGYLLSALYLGATLSLVVSALEKPNLADVPRAAASLLLKLLVGSVLAILLVWALPHFRFLTYPLLAVLFAWLTFGERWWLRVRQARQQAADASPPGNSWSAHRRR